MRSYTNLIFRLGIGITITCVVGCEKQLPPIVPADGTVFLNGKPLANATVMFVPDLSNFGGESNSMAVTDAKGHYSLVCNFNNQSGAVTANHTVVVTEGPLPDDLRNVSDGTVIDKYWATLGNRPIPLIYGSIGRSPLRVDVKEGQSVYDLTLSR